MRSNGGRRNGMNIMKKHSAQSTETMSYYYPSATTPSPSSLSSMNSSKNNSSDNNHRRKKLLAGILIATLCLSNIFDDEISINIGGDGNLSASRSASSYGLRQRQRRSLYLSGSSTLLPWADVVDPPDFGAEYNYLQAPSDIDTSIELRAKPNEGEADKCSNLVLYMPDTVGERGHGSQINTYIQAVLTATYLNRPLVLLEPPIEEGNSKYSSGGSQFGCPKDAFHEAMDTQTDINSASLTTKADFPSGFSRLIDHPNWLSRGCSVPCPEYTYQDWHKVRHTALQDGEFRDITCTNADGTTTNVYVSAGSKLRKYFRKHHDLMARNHHLNEGVRWAKNLGATDSEAETFSSRVKGNTKIWDYTLALLNRAGFLRFQPWIARDVELLIQAFELPFSLDDQYTAIHVRRGDKLETEARDEIRKYWRSRGHADVENLPTDYIPFAHYLNQWDGPDACPTNEKGGRQILKHNVYVATDDPVVVRKEIDELPNHISQDTVLWNECHELTLYFNPTDASAFHLNGDGEHGFDNPEENESDTCFARYQRSIAGIADMMILSRAKTFIGEYKSNWGRVIRSMRVRLDPIGSLTKTLDTRIAWGETEEPTPGM